jgi:hypothetical protein
MDKEFGRLDQDANKPCSILAVYPLLRNTRCEEQTWCPGASSELVYKGRPSRHSRLVWMSHFLKLSTQVLKRERASRTPAADGADVYSLSITTEAWCKKVLESFVL